MGYNYTKEFLEYHKDVVDMVRQVAKTGTTIRKSFGDDPKELANTRLLINNILRSLALNYPDEFYRIRQAVRTWTTREQGEWFLHLGVPQVKMLGRPPGAPTRTSGWLGTEPPPMRVGVEYTHDKIIGTQEDFMHLTGRILELPVETNEVTAEFADVLENLEPFVAMFGDHWNVEASGPTTLKLSRK